MVLIEKKGQRQLVESADGYPGWKVIASGLEPPPHDHCHFEGEKWVEDQPDREASKRAAKLRLMPREQFLEHIRQMIKDEVAAALKAAGV